MQWIPSGGVLAVAIACGLLAAILINVYAGMLESKYEYGAQWFYQLKADVEKGAPIQDTNLDRVSVPKPLLPAFKQAVTAEATGRQSIVGKKAPRKMMAREFLWWPDFVEEDIARIRKIPPGKEVVTIPVDSTVSFGQQLQPGGYVTIRGEFDFSSDPKNPHLEVKNVLENVQVMALGGSAAPVTEKSRPYDNIQVVVRSTVAKDLQQLQRLLKTRHFDLSLTAEPETTAAEPEISKEVRALLEKPRPAAGGSATPAPVPPKP
jgi:Flp pilus assembly protein CpaB